MKVVILVKTTNFALKLNHCCLLLSIKLSYNPCNQSQTKRGRRLSEEGREPAAGCKKKDTSSKFQNFGVVFMLCIFGSLD